MANYATLKSAIMAVIKQNGNNEITGSILQDSLLSMINSLGVGYQFMGIATPTTNPGTPDQNVFYIASVGGTYTNFGSIVLVDGLSILKYNGAWTYDQVVVGNDILKSLYAFHGIREIWLNNSIIESLDKRPAGEYIVEEQNIILVGSWANGQNANIDGRVGYTFQSEANHYSLYVHKFTSRGEQIVVKNVPSPNAEYRAYAIFDENDKLVAEVQGAPAASNCLLLSCPIGYTVIVSSKNPYNAGNNCFTNPEIVYKNIQDTYDLFTLGKFGSSILYRKSFDASLILQQYDGYIDELGDIHLWTGVNHYTTIFDVSGLRGRILNIEKVNGVNVGNISFAFYSSKTTFDSSTFIQSNPPYNDVGGSYLVRVPENADAFAFYGTRFAVAEYTEEKFREFVSLVPQKNESGPYPLYDLFGVSALSERVSEIESYFGDKSVVCWGDSLTAGAGGGGVTYPNVLQTLIGDALNVVNGGIGGESTYTIAGRQGGRVFVLGNDIVLPATTEPVEIQLTNFFGNTVAPLRQGGSEHINPCYVDGVKCVLTVQQTTSTSPDYKLFLARYEAGTESRAIKAGTPFVTNYMQKYQNVFSQIIWMGTNGEFEYSGTGDTYKNNLVDQINAMVDFANTRRFIVIGLHYVTPSGAASLANLLELETLCGKVFGAKYINWRKYLTTNALNDAGITPTSADEQAIAQGKCPPSLLSDEVHLNATGYTLLANLVYERMKQLGYV